MFKILSTDVDLLVKCVDGSLIKVLGVGEVSILQRVLFVLQLKKDLISESQFARKMGWAVSAKNLWKRVIINDDGEFLIEELIMDESNLYVVDPAYFPENLEALHVEVEDELTVAFTGMVDVVEETEEEINHRSNVDWWFRMHKRPVRFDPDAIREVRRLPWNERATTWDVNEETPVPQAITELW